MPSRGPKAVSEENRKRKGRSRKGSAQDDASKLLTENPSARASLATSQVKQSHKSALTHAQTTVGPRFEHSREGNTTNTQDLAVSHATSNQDVTVGAIHVVGDGGLTPALDDEEETTSDVHAPPTLSARVVDEEEDRPTAVEGDAVRVSDWTFDLADRKVQLTACLLLFLIVGVSAMAAAITIVLSRSPSDPNTKTPTLSLVKAPSTTATPSVSVLNAPFSPAPSEAEKPSPGGANGTTNNPGPIFQPGPDATQTFQMEIDYVDRSLSEDEGVTFESLMSSYTDKFSRSSATVSTECNFRYQEPLRVRQLQNGGVRALAVFRYEVTFIMVYESATEDVSAFPSLFAEFVNNNLSVVLQDLKDANLPIDNLYDVVPLPSQAPSPTQTSVALNCVSQNYLQELSRTGNDLITLSAFQKNSFCGVIEGLTRDYDPVRSDAGGTAATTVCTMLGDVTGTTMVVFNYSLEYCSTEVALESLTYGYHQAFEDHLRVDEVRKAMIPSLVEEVGIKTVVSIAPPQAQSN